MALTDKKKAFAQALFDGASNREAAIFAGYSPETASAAGSRLAKDADVLAHVESLKNVKAAPVNVKADKRPAINTQSIAAASKELADPLEFLESVYSDDLEEMKYRVAAAVAAMPYVHGKIAAKGKKETKAEEAKGTATSGGKFGTLDNQITRPS